VRVFGSWRRPAQAGVVGITIAAAAGGYTSPAIGFTSHLAAARHTASGPVSAIPASGTPQLVQTGKEENVRHLVQCGGKIYAVGTFTSIRQRGSTFSRNNVFSFSATKPYAVTSWNPDVNGTVNSIAFAGGHCAHAYLGGSFTKVNGASATNIAKVSTATGRVVASFGHDANQPVETLLAYRDHLLAGGFFTRINGSGRDPYYASLNQATGRDDGFLRLDIHGSLVRSPTKVYDQQLGHTGKRLLVEGTFTSVAGRPRQQIFMLNLDASQAGLTGWTSPEFNSSCIRAESFYVRDAAWSPDDSTIYIADTGDHLLNWSGHAFPLTGLCDAAAAFPAQWRSVSHAWINYTGCDSLYSVAADSSAVYVAAHPRWSENANACNKKGPGAITDPGMQGLSPGNGHTIMNAKGSARYTMSRANADDMLITSAGLWIASSNRQGSSRCGGVGGHAGICFLPYR
jgi:hypothetical protein